MIDISNNRVNCMAIAIAKFRGVKPEMIKLNQKPRNKAAREIFVQYVTFSWCPYLEEAKGLVAAYDKELDKSGLR